MGARHSITTGENEEAAEDWWSHHHFYKNVSYLIQEKHSIIVDNLRFLLPFNINSMRAHHATIQDKFMFEFIWLPRLPIDFIYECSMS